MQNLVELCRDQHVDPAHPVRDHRMDLGCRGCCWGEESIDEFVWQGRGLLASLDFRSDLKPIDQHSAQNRCPLS